MAPQPTSSDRVRRSSGSTSGWALRRSCQTNATSSAAATPNPASVLASVQPRLDAWVSARAVDSTVAVHRTALGTLSEVCLRIVSSSLGSSFGAASAQTTASGRLIRNTQRHETVVSRPPIMTPAARPDAPTVPHTDSALLRSGPAANEVLIRAMTAGCRIAAAMPCAARATMSTGVPGASPPASEAMPNSSMPTMKSVRGPKRSEARPPTTRKPAKNTA